MINGQKAADFSRHCFHHRPRQRTLRQVPERKVHRLQYKFCHFKYKLRHFQYKLRRFQYKVRHFKCKLSPRSCSLQQQRSNNNNETTTATATTNNDNTTAARRRNSSTQAATSAATTTTTTPTTTYSNTTPSYEHLRHTELLRPAHPFAGGRTASQPLPALRNLVRRAAAVYSGRESFLV